MTHSYIFRSPPLTFPSSSASGGFSLKKFDLSKTLLIADSTLIYVMLYYFAIALANVDLPLFALP